MKRFLFSLLRRVFNSLREVPSVERLRKWGAVVGDDVELISVECSKKDATCLEIGSHVTLTGCLLLTHDASPQHFLGNGINRIGRIVIGNNVFVGRKSILLPNVKIGSNVIIGAGSVVTRNIPDNVVAAGNPCRVLSSIEEWKEKQKKNMENNIYWNINRDCLSREEREAFNKDIDGRIVYLGRRKKNQS